MNRRQFLTTGLGAAAAAAGTGCAALRRGGAAGTVMTVTGPVPAAELGRTLIHEHVAVDFIGADRSEPPRVDPESAFRTALPHFERLHRQGVRTLVECTPRFIGRQVRLLRRLSEASGVRIVTNTGWYAAVNHRYLPPEAQTASVDTIAAGWLREWERGIDDTGIRPGFVKLGTGTGALPPVDARLLRAAARVHRETGLPVFVHTGDGPAARDEVRLLAEEGVAPEALVWVHAQNDPGPIQLELARRGVWVSLDGYSLSPTNVTRYTNQLAAHREAGTLRRVLVSHDDGWSVEGDGPAASALKLFGNGNPAPYESLFTRLLPDLRARGFTDDDFRQLLEDNPREVLSRRTRLLS